MLPEVKRAMDEASQNFVMIHDLQAKVGKRLAELTGAEAAFVSAGASASLCLAACAVTTGGDPEKMDQLPHLDGPIEMKSEIIIQKIHRGSYDHAFRMVGVKLVEVETEEEMRAAIGPKTAALAMVMSHNSLGHKVSLEEMIAIAHEADLPVILDAAAELPPVENLSKFVGMGADLVAFSGGKNLRGPQCAGLLLGKKELIDAVKMNASPKSAIGRGMKVGKEEIIALLNAVDRFLDRTDEMDLNTWNQRAQHIVKALDGVPGTKAYVLSNGQQAAPDFAPRAYVELEDRKAGEVIDALRTGDPPIVIRRSSNGIVADPMTLRSGEEEIVGRRLREVLTSL